MRDAFLSAAQEGKDCAISFLCGSPTEQAVCGGCISTAEPDHALQLSLELRAAWKELQEAENVASQLHQAKSDLYGELSHLVYGDSRSGFVKGSKLQRFENLWAMAHIDSISPEAMCLELGPACVQLGAEETADAAAQRMLAEGISAANVASVLYLSGAAYIPSGSIVCHEDYVTKSRTCAHQSLVS